MASIGTIWDILPPELVEMVVLSCDELIHSLAMTPMYSWISYLIRLNKINYREIFTRHNVPQDPFILYNIDKISYATAGNKEMKQWIEENSYYMGDCYIHKSLGELIVNSYRNTPNEYTLWYRYQDLPRLTKAFYTPAYEERSVYLKEFSDENPEPQNRAADLDIPEDYVRVYSGYPCWLFQTRTTTYINYGPPTTTGINYGSPNTYTLEMDHDNQFIHEVLDLYSTRLTREISQMRYRIFNRTSVCNANHHEIRLKTKRACKKLYTKKQSRIKTPKGLNLNKRHWHR